MNPPTGIVVVPGTDYWVVEGDTHLGKWAIEKGDIVTDPHLFRWLRPYIKECKFVFSVGANIGDHVAQYERWNMRVVAFEAHPVTFQCLKHNCPDSICLNVAVSNEEGSLPFMGLDNVGASRVHKDGEWSVPAHALDDMFLLVNPDFIELDIEGFEPNAITGMAGIITRYKPIILTEMNRGALAAHGFTVEGYREQIESLGYHVAGLYPPNAKWDDEQFDVLFQPIK